MINMVTAGAVHCLIVTQQKGMFPGVILHHYYNKGGFWHFTGVLVHLTQSITLTNDIKVITLSLLSHFTARIVFIVSCWKCVLVSWCPDVMYFRSESEIYDLGRVSVRVWQSRALSHHQITRRGCPSSPAHKTANFHCVTLSLSLSLAL